MTTTMADQSLSKRGLNAFIASAISFTVLTIGCQRSVVDAPVEVPPSLPSKAPAVLPPLEAARRAARVLVDDKKLPEAIAVLERALADVVDATTPFRPETRCDLAALYAREAMANADLQHRERRLQQGLGLCPDQAQLPSLLADTLLGRSRIVDDVGLKQSLLRESLKRKVSVAALVDLAILLEQQDEPKEALALAEQAQALAPEDARLKALVARLKKTADVEGNFKSARHSHFVARFEGYGEERLAFSALDVLEGAYFSVGKALDLYPVEPTTVVIYTGQQYRQATTAPDWSTGLFDGKIRIREGQLAANDGSLDDTLMHEYVHAALHSLPVKVPSWFHEGLAQHFEKRRPSPSRLVGRTGVANREAMNAQFTSLPADVVPAAYVTAHALVERLVERRGAWGLRQLVAELKTGRSFDEALQRSYAIDVDVLYTEVQRTLTAE